MGRLQIQMIPIRVRLKTQVLCLLHLTRQEPPQHLSRGIHIRPERLFLVKRQRADLGRRSRLDARGALYGLCAADSGRAGAEHVARACLGALFDVGGV